jgi:peroxiredoxin
MLALGTPAPPFSLPDVVSKRAVSLDSFASRKALLFMFLCHHCPFVKHIKDELARLGHDHAARDLGIVAISSNDPAVSSEDSPEGLARMVAAWGLNYPVCFDESQDVAKSYEAACTPDFFLFDAARRLVYRGQLDASRPGQRQAHNRRRSACGNRCRARRPRGRPAPDAEHWLQHQMAPRRTSDRQP